MVLFCVSMGLIVIAALFGATITVDKNNVLEKRLKQQTIIADSAQRALNRKTISAQISGQEAVFYREEVKRLERALRDKNRELIRLRTEVAKNENI